MVPVVESIEAVRESVRRARGSGKVIGFVPTMGALHEGHARLIEQCRAEAGFTIVSIFVNPTQFGPSEDLSRYPKTPEGDLQVCERAGADLVFSPTASTMFPRVREGTYVEVPGLSGVLEGASRPGHFRGVATVVLKLFEIVGPEVAYFGQKDFQQWLLVRRMVEDLNLPVDVRKVATVRDPDGLALSSRNRYLDPVERRAAIVLAKALNAAGMAVAAGERNADRVRQILRQTVQSEPLARLDYAEVADGDSLEPLAELEPGRRSVALLAVRIGATRLIDNTMLTE